MARADEEGDEEDEESDVHRWTKNEVEMTGLFKALFRPAGPAFIDYCVFWGQKPRRQTLQHGR